MLSPQRQQQAAANELAYAMELSVREELRLADTLEKGVEMLRQLIDERAEQKSECAQPESLHIRRYPGYAAGRSEKL